MREKKNNDRVGNNTALDGSLGTERDEERTVELGIMNERPRDERTRNAEKKTVVRG